MTHKLANRNLPLLLSRARELVISHFRPILKHFGLTEQQWRVLRLLADHKHLEPRHICQQCQILSPSMAGILKRLKEMGLVKRKSVTHDRRRVLISLTVKSERLISKIAPHVRQQYENIEQALGSHLVQQLYAALDGLLDGEHQAVKAVQFDKKKAAGINK